MKENMFQDLTDAIYISHLWPYFSIQINMGTESILKENSFQFLYWLIHWDCSEGRLLTFTIPL